MSTPGAKASPRPRAAGLFGLAHLAFGPIFQREVRAAGRRRWPYLARSVYALLLALVVFAFFMSTLDDRESQSRTEALQAVQQIAPALLITTAWVQFFVLSLAGPTLAGGAICDEKRARTLAVLMTTPISATQIVASKLTSRLTQMLILALIPLPLLLAVRVFGGVPTDAVLRCVTLSITTGVLGASVALALSVFHTRAAHASLSAIFCMALITAGPVTLEAIRVMASDQRGQPWWPIFATCSPFVLGTISAEIAGDGGGVPFNTSHLFLINQAYVLGITALVLLAAARRLRRSLALEAAGGAPAPADDPAAGPASSRASSRLVSDAPILWRELRQKAFASRRQFIILLVAVAIALGWLYIRFGLREEGVHISIAVIATVAILFQALFNTTGGIASERESSTWNVLLTTPLSGREIMASKFAGAIRRQWFAPTILALDIILGVLAGGISPLAFVILPPLLLGPMIFLTGAGLLFSLRFQRAITASVVNLILGVSLWVGSFFVIGLFDLVVGNWSLSRSLYQVSYTINPVAMIGSAVEGLTDRYGTLGRSIELNFDLSADSLGPAGFLAISWLVGGAYAGIGIGMLALASRRFRRWSGRSS